MGDSSHSILEISGDRLSIEDIVRVGNSDPGKVVVRLSEKAEDSILKSRKFVDEAIGNKFTERKPYREPT